MSRDAAKRIHAFDLQAREHRRHVFDRVVRAGTVVVVVDVACGCERAAEIVIGRDALHQIDERVILAAQRERAVLICRQTHKCLTTEQATALPQSPRARVKAIFQLENSLQTAAQIFLAFQAPAGTGKIAVTRVADRPLVLAGRIGVMNKRNGGINRAVKRDTALCVRCARST